MKPTPKTNPISTQPTPAPPAFRRQDISEAPETAQRNFTLYCLQGRPLQAVIAAFNAGYRIRRDQLETPATDKLAKLTDPGLAATYRARESVKLRGEAAAIAKIAALEGSPWIHRNLADDRAAEQEGRRNAEANRVASINKRVEELRAKKAEDAERQLRQEAEFGAPKGAA